MDIISKEQFDYVCNMLKAQGKKPSKENIAMYLRLNNKQMKKFVARIEGKQRTFELGQKAFLQNLVFRVKLFGYWVILYKPGIKGRFYKLEILRSKE